jgi:hypothetical protein
MPEQPSKPYRRSASSTPSEYPVSAPPQPLPGADYSYTVELVATIHHELGRLTEAVNSLKDHSKERDQKLDEVMKEVNSVAKDVHAAKAAGKTLLWVMGVVGALLGTVIGTYMQARFSNHPMDQGPRVSSSQQSAPR